MPAANTATATTNTWRRSIPISAAAGASSATPRAATPSAPSGPGLIRFRNDGCAWRPAHIHLSIFGHAFVQRLVTQLYFEGDPLIQRCVIVNTIKDPKAIDSLVAKLDMESMQAFDCLAYRFDIVLRGRKATSFEGS